MKIYSFYYLQIRNKVYFVLKEKYTIINLIDHINKILDILNLSIFL
jgi:hypothetical protein